MLTLVSAFYMKPIIRCSRVLLAAVVYALGDDDAVLFKSVAWWALNSSKALEACRGIKTNPFACHDRVGALRVAKYALNNARLGGLDPERTREVEDMLHMADRLLSFIDPPEGKVPDRFVRLMKYLHTLQAILEPVKDHLAHVDHSKASTTFHVSRYARDDLANETTTLSNGVEMPLAGFGTWQLKGDVAQQAVLAALRAGVRHIDTAQGYNNEREVGEALRIFRQESGIQRSDLFIVSKLSALQDFGYQEARSLVLKQLETLGIEYLDVYLLHRFHYGNPAGVTHAWMAMEELHQEGRIRALGVSNFQESDIDDLLGRVRIRPVYVQAKFSIYQPGAWRMKSCSNQTFIEWCRERAISVVGYSVLNAAQGFDLQPTRDPHVVAIARKHGCTAAEVLHRWATLRGIAVIPRSTNTKRIKENLFFLKVKLDAVDLQKLDGIVTLIESTASIFWPIWSADPYHLKRPPVLELGNDDMPELPGRIQDVLLENFSQKASRVARILRSGHSGAHWFTHSRDVMSSHLIGTYKILHAWNMPEDLCLAGLVHSAYGAGGNFNFTLWTLDQRENLMELIGAQAERISYLYGVLDWGAFVRFMGSRGAKPEGQLFETIHGDSEWVRPEDAAWILIIAMADFIEQRVSGSGAWSLWQRPLPLLETSIPRIWGGLWDVPYNNLGMVSFFCRFAREAATIRAPTIFSGCWEVADGNAEAIAGNIYWDAKRTLHMYYHESIEEAKVKLMTAVTRDLYNVTMLSPFIGEPWVLLGQIHLFSGELAKAKRAAREGLTRLIQMGCAWDASHVYSGWIGIARLTHYRASRLLKGFPDMPRSDTQLIHLPDVWGRATVASSQPAQEKKKQK